MKTPRKFPGRGRYLLAFVGALTLWGLLPAVREPAHSGRPAPVAVGLTEAPSPRTAAPPRIAVDDRAARATPVSRATMVPIEHWSEPPGTDVVAEPFPLVAAQLDALTTGATLTLPNPNGGEVVLRVEAIHVQGDDKHLRLSHAGLPSSVTLTQRQFFATLATPDGVFALTGDAQGTHLIRHTELDLRNLHEADYRPAQL